LGWTKGSLYQTLKRVETNTPEYIDLFELISSKGLTLDLGAPGDSNVRTKRVQNTQIWNNYLRVRQEIVESLFLASEEHSPPPRAFLEDVYFIVAEARDCQSVPEKGLLTLRHYLIHHCVRLWVNASDAVKAFLATATPSSSKVLLPVLAFTGWSNPQAADSTIAVAPPVRALTSRTCSRKECIMFDSCCDAQDQQEAHWFDIFDVRQMYPMYSISLDISSPVGSSCDPNSASALW